MWASVEYLTTLSQLRVLPASNGRVTGNYELRIIINKTAVIILMYWPAIGWRDPGQAYDSRAMGRELNQQPSKYKPGLQAT
jgi:hypothetical protein